jgi:NodT family efflux transporter outer membrane factor (OMF) lipoprotein
LDNAQIYPTPSQGRARRRFAPALMLLLAVLSGCVVGPNFSPPATPTDQHYRSETQRSEQPAAQSATQQQIDYGHDVAGDWWSLFHSDALDAIVNDAVAGNHGLAAMKATLAQTEELALSVSGSRYPQVGLTGGIGRQKYGAEFFGGNFNLAPFTYFAVGPTVSYTLDYNGGVARSVERQYALVDSSRQQFNAAYLSVTGQAVMQAIAIGSAHQQISMVETLLAQDRDNLKLVQGAFEAGSVARIDILSAQSQIDSDMTLLPPLRQELSRARHALSILLGRTPASASVPDIDLDKIPLPMALPVGVPSELAHHRPDILQAEAQLHAATSAVGVAESNLYPKIQLTATVAQEAVTPGRLIDGSSTAWSLLSGFTAPLFDGGSLRAQKRAAIDALRASAANYEQTVIEAFGQVADLLDALDHDAEQLNAEMQAQETARSGLDLARASYAEGNAGILQVLDAQRVYQQSRLGYARAVAQRYLDTAQLVLALGGSSPSSGAAPPKSTPDASS